MTDQRLDKVIGALLQVGVLLSAAVVLTGGVWLLVDAGDRTPSYHQFNSEPPDLRSVHRLIPSLAHPRPETIVQLGLLLLIATPVARVIFSLAAFAIERDWAYVAITLIVLCVLAYSLAPHG